MNKKTTIFYQIWPQFLLAKTEECYKQWSYAKD